jgi:hypothetical protein
MSQKSEKRERRNEEWAEEGRKEIREISRNEGR